MDKLNLEIVPAKLAIKAMMDSGYKNAAYALAELMDNSIEAGAKSVELLCLERYVSLNQKTVKRIDQIGILDNGNGMDLDTLRIALRFGDGTRLDESKQKGMGKFGFGLPNASISQAKMIEVWSWQKGSDNAIYTYLDINKIIGGEQTSIVEPTKKEIPLQWKLMGKDFAESGTLIVWSKLERCMWKTGNAIIQNSEFLIGRMYRKFLEANKTKIRMAIFDGDSSAYKCVKEHWAQPNDPLYLIAGSTAPPPYDEIPMFSPWPSESSYETKIDINYKNQKHVVIIRTSMAKNEARAGDAAGNNPFGIDAKKNIGVSIIRAGRELDLDPSWANFGEARERWWGLEIEFPPSLDEVFGVSNDKQHARNFTDLAKVDFNDWLEDGKTIQQLRDELKEEDDPRAPLVEIAFTVKSLINQMRKLVIEQNKQTRGNKRKITMGSDPEKEATRKTKERQGEGHSGLSDAGESEPQAERERAIKDAILQLGLTEKEAEEKVDQIMQDKLKYEFMHGSLDSPAFFSVQPRGGVILITLNTNHPAYSRLVDVLEDDENNNAEDLQERLNKALDGLKLLLYAWARYEDEQQSEQARSRAQEARIDWGRMARRFLDPDV